MKPPRMVLIAAVSRNGVLSADGKIPWHLPRDMAHFRARAAGRWLLLGRTTYEQMRGWFQPGQVPVVLTRQAGYAVAGGWAAASLEAALELAAAHGAAELLVCGGAQVYETAMARADEIILTKVEMEVAGDVFFPAMADGDWKVLEQEVFPADAENATMMTITRYRSTVAGGP